MTTLPGPIGGGVFQFVPLFIGLIFVIVIGTLIFRAISGARQWSRNNKQDILTTPAKLVTKRTEVRSYGSSNQTNGTFSNRTRTYYYATFEAEAGQRFEFRLSGPEYGLLAEGDVGSLTYQGTRFKGFKRN